MHIEFGENFSKAKKLADRGFFFSGQTTFSRPTLSLADLKNFVHIFCQLLKFGLPWKAGQSVGWKRIWLMTEFKVQINFGDSNIFRYLKFLNFCDVGFCDLFMKVFCGRFQPCCVIHTFFQVPASISRKILFYKTCVLAFFAWRSYWCRWSSRS